MEPGILLLNPDGLMMSVGIQIGGGAYETPRENYILVTPPDDIRHMYHRRIILQTVGQAAGILVEIDPSLSEDGETDVMVNDRADVITQDAVDKAIRKALYGSFLLRSTSGKAYMDFVKSHLSDVDAVMDFGQDIIESGEVYGPLDYYMIEQYERYYPQSTN
jgi:hypothetical protein